MIFRSALLHSTAFGFKHAGVPFLWGDNIMTSAWLNTLVGTPERNVPLASMIDRLDSANETEKLKIISDIARYSTDAEHAQVLRSGIAVMLKQLHLFHQKQNMDPLVDIVEFVYNVLRDRSSSPVGGFESSVIEKSIDLVVKDSSILNLLLKFFESSDKTLLYQTTKLLTLLLNLRRREIQAFVLTSPVGVLTFVDLLKSNLLLLRELTNTNEEIQKIVAFSGVMETLLDIVQEEGMNNGGFVVVDCLSVIKSLLNDNPLTSRHFRESDCLRRLSPIFELDSSDMWILTDDKTEILQCALFVLSHLVTVSNPQDVYLSQQAIASHGILEKVMKLALGGINSTIVRSIALWTLGNLIRGNCGNCNILQLSKYKIAYKEANREQFAVNRLTSIVFSSKVMKERIAGVIAFECYFHDNEDAQLAITSTCNPKPDGQPMEEDDAPGRLLLGKLLSWQESDDIYSPWCAALVLSSMLGNNARCKQLMLKIQLEISSLPGQLLESLLTKVVRSVILSIKANASHYVQVGMLRFLCVWLSSSSESVNAFLRTPSHPQFFLDLVAESTSTNIHIAGLSAGIIAICISSSQNISPQTSSQPSSSTSSAANASILPELVDSIGKDKFLGAMQLLMSSEDFSNASEKQYQSLFESAQPLTKPPLYDHSFSHLFRSIHHTATASFEGTLNTAIKGISNDSEIIQFYKEMAEDQEAKMKKYEALINHLQSQVSSSRNGDNPGTTDVSSGEMAMLKKKVESYEKELIELRSFREQMEPLRLHQHQQIEQNNMEIKQLQQKLAQEKSEHEKLKMEHEELLVLLAEQSGSDSEDML